MKALLIIVFVLLAAAQWYVPVSMIRESELVLTDGTELKIRTQPIDPSDPFRGKYVTLNFETPSFVMDTTTLYSYGMEIWASIGFDEDGYAVIDTIHATQPKDLLAVKVEVTGISYDSGTQLIEVTYPFDRFYVEESKASEAEKIYWESLLPDVPEKQTYAVVRVRNGRSVLTDVRIGDRSILDIVKDINADTTDVAR